MYSSQYSVSRRDVLRGVAATALSSSLLGCSGKKSDAHDHPAREARVVTLDLQLRDRDVVRFDEDHVAGGAAAERPAFAHRIGSRRLDHRPRAGAHQGDRLVDDDVFGVGAFRDRDRRSDR